MFLLGICTIQASTLSAMDLSTRFNTYSNTLESTGRISPALLNPSTGNTPMEEEVQGPERRVQQVPSEDGSAGRATSATS